MKIQILKDIKDSIDGFNPILLTDEDIQIDEPSNSITNILMIDTLEQISYENIDSFLIKMINLLRLNGEIVLGGVDVECINKDLLSGKIDIETYNKIIFSKRGIYSSHRLIEKLNALNLKINKITVKGSVYEIQASRSN